MNADVEFNGWLTLAPAYKAKFLNTESLSVVLDEELELFLASLGLLVLLGDGEGELFKLSLAFRLFAIDDEDAEEDGGDEADDDMLFANLFNISSLETLFLLVFCYCFVVIVIEYLVYLFYFDIFFFNVI